MSGKIDLSTLPPEIRQKVEAGLAKLPPEARRQWEAQGSPLLAKLVSGLSGMQASAGTPPPQPAAPNKPPATPWRSADRPARTATENVSPPREAPPAQGVIRRTPPWGHYNDTILPGDRPGLLQRVLLGAAIAGVAAWWFR